MQEELQLNQKHWNEAAEIHGRGNVYGIEDFKKGVCQLFRIEVSEVGDVRGKSLLHLQCHFGLDTLSWARRGAKVTGVDFSPTAIGMAKQISAETGVPGDFIETNIYDVRDVLKAPASFDIVFTSYGVMNWLPDLTKWAEIIAHYLKPGGFFYIIEAHPTARMFPMTEDVQAGAESLKPCFEYFHDPKGKYWPPNLDYADASAKYTAGEYCWQHSLGDVVNALIGAGLRIEWLREFPVCAWNVIDPCQRFEPEPGSTFGYSGLPKTLPQVPLTFSIRARKP